MFEASSERGSAKRCPEYGLCLLQPAYHGRRHSAPGQAGLPVTGSAAGENVSACTMWRQGRVIFFFELDDKPLIKA